MATTWKCYGAKHPMYPEVELVFLLYGYAYPVDVAAEQATRYVAGCFSESDRCDVAVLSAFPRLVK